MAKLNDVDPEAWLRHVLTQEIRCYSNHVAAVKWPSPNVADTSARRILDFQTVLGGDSRWWNAVDVDCKTFLCSRTRPHVHHLLSGSAFCSDVRS